MFEYSTENWTCLISSLGAIYAIYLMSQSTQSIIKGSKSQLYGFAFMIFFIIYGGTRPLWCYDDSDLYSTIYNLAKSGFWGDLGQNTSEWFFSWVEWRCIGFTDAHGWFFVIECFYILGMCYAAWRWMPRHFTMAVFFMFTAFSFWSYSNNGIRQGMGASLALAGMACLTPQCRKNWPKLAIAILIMYLGASCHRSFLLTIAAALAFVFMPNKKIPFYVWLICLALSPFSSDFISSFAGSFIDDGRISYYQASQGTHLFSRTGWRWDFIIYSFMPILLGWYVIFKNRMGDWYYEMLLSVYLYTNAAWLLVNSIPYSNRFAYISWMLYPFLLCMPLAKFPIFKQQGTVAGAILLGCIIFTWII